MGGVRVLAHTFRWSLIEIRVAESNRSVLNWVSFNLRKRGGGRPRRIRKGTGLRATRMLFLCVDSGSERLVGHTGGAFLPALGVVKPSEFRRLSHEGHLAFPRIPRRGPACGAFSCD